MQDINLNDRVDNTEIRILTETEKLSIENPITMTELSEGLKRMNNNKSPGSDGFPADFYKVFWSKLKFILFRVINETFETELLSNTSII